MKKTPDTTPAPSLASPTVTPEPAAQSIPQPQPGPADEARSLLAELGIDYKAPPTSKGQAARAKHEACRAKAQEYRDRQAALQAEIDHKRENDRAAGIDRDKTYDALKALSEQLQKARLLLPEYEQDETDALRELEIAELEDDVLAAAVAGRTARAVAGRLQDFLDHAAQDAGPLLSALQEGRCAFDRQAADVVSRGGPAPLASFTIPLAPLLVLDSPDKVNVCRSLSALFADLAEAPQREVEARAQAAQTARLLAQDYEAAALRGEFGEAEKVAALGRLREGIRKFHGHAAVGNTLSCLPSPAARVEE